MHSSERGILCVLTDCHQTRCTAGVPKPPGALRRLRFCDSGIGDASGVELGVRMSSSHEGHQVCAGWGPSGLGGLCLPTFQDLPRAAVRGADAKIRWAVSLRALRPCEQRFLAPGTWGRVVAIMPELVPTGCHPRTTDTVPGHCPGRMVGTISLNGQRRNGGWSSPWVREESPADWDRDGRLCAAAGRQAQGSASVSPRRRPLLPAAQSRRLSSRTMCLLSWEGRSKRRRAERPPRGDRGRPSMVTESGHPTSCRASRMHHERDAIPSLASVSQPGRNVRLLASAHSQGEGRAPG